MRSITITLSALLFVACGDKDTTADSGAAVTPDDTSAATDDTGSTGDDTGGADDTGSADDTGGADDTGETGDTGDTGEPKPEPDVAEFGFDDTRLLEVLGDAGDGLDIPRDLAFHPERDELWVANRYGLPGFIDGGSATIYSAPGTADQSALTLADAHAYHFMDETSSLAFGAATYSESSELTFATCQESRNDYGGFYRPDNFMGPVLWPSDLKLYANIYQDHPVLGGSHLDMLHESPECMGIAWHAENAYWAFDGWNGHLVYYDFQDDHGPGGDDHSDGIVRRYEEIELTRVADVPGHMEVDHDTGWLYIADTGAGRIVRVDTATGSVIGLSDIPTLEPLEEYTVMGGVTWEVVAEGLSNPSGLALKDGRVFASENATGEIVAIDIETGSELGRMGTMATGLMGLAFDNDGMLWYVDAAAQEVVRVDPGI